MAREGSSTRLLADQDTNYGSATPREPAAVVAEGQNVRPASTGVDVLGRAGRIIGGSGLLGFVVSATGLVGWPVAACALGLMAAGTSLCVASEIKKECSRPRPAISATPLRESATASAEGSTLASTTEGNEKKMESEEVAVSV